MSNISGETNVSITATIPPATIDSGITLIESELLSYGCKLLIGGVLSILLNVCIGVGIVRSDQLRSRFYVCLCFLTFTRATIALTYTVKGIYDALNFAGRLPMYLPYIGCQMIYFFITVSSFAEELLLLLLVIDRSLAIVLPMFYRKLTIRQAVLTCVGIELLTAVTRWFLAYVDGDLLRPVRCVSIYSSLPKFFEVEYQTLALVTLIVCLLLYFALIVVTLWRVRQMKRLSTASEQYVFLQRQMALLPVLLSCAGCHVTLALFSRLCVLLSTWVPSHATRLYSYSAVSQAIDLFLGAVAMLGSKRELQQECLPSCIGNKIGVDSVSRTN